MITREQINAFHMIATCAYAAKGEELYELEKICDPCAKSLFDKLWMVRGWLDAICGYNPDSPYCLDDTQILNIIEATKKALCLCGDVNSLPEVALCIPCIQSGTPELEINEITWTCVPNTDDANACYTITVVNGSGQYELLINYNGQEFAVAIPFTGGTGTYSQCIYASGSPSSDITVEVSLHDIGKDATSESVNLTITSCGGGGGPSGSGSGSGTPIIESIVLDSLEFACAIDSSENGSIRYAFTVTGSGSGKYALQLFSGFGWSTLHSINVASGSGSFNGTYTYVSGNKTLILRVIDTQNNILSNSLAIQTTVCPYIESLHIISGWYSCIGGTANQVTVNYNVSNGSGSYYLEYFNPDTSMWTSVYIFAGPQSADGQIVEHGFGRNDGGNYNFRLRDPNKNILSNVINIQTSICT